MDNQEIKIPRVQYEGTDQGLLKRVRLFKTGSLRILIFAIVGLIMGWYSINYYTDTFIVTKVILAIPYKISEAIYTSIIGTSANYYQGGMLMRLNAFFEQSGLATFLAERGTPVLIGGAIYGAIGYFTGDKNVFTLRRFVKFTAVWCAVILMFIGSVYAVNAKAIADNDNLKDIYWFFLTTPNQGEAISDEERHEMLMAALYDGLQKDKGIQRDWENEHELEILFDDGLRSMIAYVNWNCNYLVTENNTTYHVSETFAGYIKEYYETGTLMGVQTIFPAVETEAFE